ncbi:hypothetical protein ACRARG_02230 [Pseudooceanicola sp. C21-150M6]|uniref:hypothetical protein n=1 Tax=Pseudooceanicola sp. C21-150M6 TaxID=3434355 RepID=UPI003D7F4CF8
MKRLMMTTMAVAIALPVTAMANPGKGHGNGHGNGKKVHKQVHREVQQQSAPRYATNCPPGLAKKSPACVPLGLAKKQHDDRDYVVHVGEYLNPDYFGDRYVLVRDPGYYGLDPYGVYYRIDGNVYQVDRETREVLALLGAVSAILN